MLPLLDVVFLLLVFFIYAMMVRPEILPVTLTTLTHGQQMGNTTFATITVDRGGRLFFNREPMDAASLDVKLADLARDPAKPTLYLAMESSGDVDRGPVFLKLIEQVRNAGITNFAIVGATQSTKGAEATP